MTSLVPGEIMNAVQSAYGTVEKFSPAHGGCINNGGRLLTSSGEIFIKWNSARKYPRMFEAESYGLSQLAVHSPLRVPRVFDVIKTGEYQILLLELILEKKRNTNYWYNLGEGLAATHKTTDATFGLLYDNYIGSLPQNNAKSDSLVEFYVKSRFMPQLELARQSDLLTKQDGAMFEKLFTRLNEILPQQNPALLHGDLWSGNIMCDEQGQPVLIDPAIYFGAPEADLAMTRLFGGFDTKFYEAYFAASELPTGIEERIEIYQLYPLLVHVNLFGRSYASQVREILSRFT